MDDECSAFAALNFDVRMREWLPELLRVIGYVILASVVLSCGAVGFIGGTEHYAEMSQQQGQDESDGDTNDDYENINDTSKKDTAVTTLISHLDKVLTGGVLPSDYHTALKTHLMNINYSSTKNKKEALAIMRDAIRFIVTSSAFMIQK